MNILNYGVSGENENIKGVSDESLKRSREIRSEFKLKYGIIPTSILKSDRSIKSLDYMVDQSGYSYKDTYFIKEGKYKDTGFRLRGSGTRSRKHINNNDKRTGSLSRFPQNIGRIILDFYCPKGGTVYDPFAGHNSRMELVYKSGRNYIGVDVSHEFMNANFKIKFALESMNRLKLFGENYINLIEGSSHKVEVINSLADFTITSPPYFNIEYYGNEEEQLGNSKTYKDFLDKLFYHVAENYRILKEGAFCCWFINDFRLNGVFYPFHIDLYMLFLKAGFIPFTIYIIDLGTPIAAAFVQSILQTKIFPKRHEYCLIFRKE